MGINLAGATHDAIAYRRTLAASRLEGPVIYEGPGKAGAPTFHSGAKVARIVNENPEVMPDINIPVDRISSVSTSVAGVARRLIYDYQKVERDGRSVQLQFLEAASHFRIESRFGALVLAWAEAPTTWDDRSGPDLFSF